MINFSSWTMSFLTTPGRDVVFSITSVAPFVDTHVPFAWWCNSPKLWMSNYFLAQCRKHSPGKGFTWLSLVDLMEKVITVLWQHLSSSLYFFLSTRILHTSLDSSILAWHLPGMTQCRAQHHGCGMMQPGRNREGAVTHLQFLVCLQLRK